VTDRHNAIIFYLGALASSAAVLGDVVDPRWVGLAECAWLFVIGHFCEMRWRSAL